MKITRGYATPQDLKNEGLDMSDDDAYKLIAKAEAFVDAFCGPQARDRGDHLTRITDFDPSSNIMTLDRPGFSTDGFWDGAAIEFLATESSAQGQSFGILKSENGTLKVKWSDSMNTGSEPLIGSTVRLYQVGEFPRSQDVDSVNGVRVNIIPTLIREATIQQALYIDAMGDDFFNGDKQNLKSESVDGYSYSRDEGSTSGSFLSPRARRTLINGRFKRRTGEIVDY